MHRLQTMFVALGTVASLCLAFGSGRLEAYSTYHPSSATSGCYQCHPGFAGRGPLHDVHVGNSQMTSTCTLCHQNQGDNPSIGQSPAGPGCTGCHAPEGLRLHHLRAEAPPDGQGRTCTTCHAGDGPPAAEKVAPPYYARADVDVKDPCVVASSSGGEDWDGDGSGLDNDGDLAYELTDTDCATAVQGRTWGTVKSLYNR